MNVTSLKPSDINIHRGLGGSFVQNREAEIAANNIIILAQATNNNWPENFTKKEYEEKVKQHPFASKFISGEDGLLNLKNAGCLKYDEQNEEYSLTDKFFKLIEYNKW